MINVKNVSKYFGRFQALDDVSFDIDKGEIVGFLGQNGAGKTTLMRILTTYLPVTSGKVSIDGISLDGNTMKIRQKMGYLPETPPLYPNMVVKDYLIFAAQLKEVPQKQIKLQVDRVLDECYLDDVQDKVIGILSKGYKQRVGIAQAIINDPQLLILDEPTSGLDPIQNKQMRKLIKKLENKRTVILSTHILPEIEQIAKRILIIKDGKIITDEMIHNLLGKTGVKKKIILRVKGYGPLMKQALTDLQSYNVINMTTEEETVHQIELEIVRQGLNYNDLIESILKSKGHIIEIVESKASLEDIFLNTVSEHSND